MALTLLKHPQIIHSFCLSTKNCVVLEDIAWSGFAKIITVVSGCLILKHHFALLEYMSEFTKTSGTLWFLYNVMS